MIGITQSTDNVFCEKLIRYGPSVLTNSEILAILLGNGSCKEKALESAKGMMSLCNNELNKLGKMTLQDMVKIRGVGMAKATTVLAAIELGRRRQAAATLCGPVITRSSDIGRFLKPLFQDLTYEVFAVLFLNRANRLNHFEVISEGGLTSTIADPRKILKKALQHDAVYIILCHNHPSGSINPSRADKEITNKIKTAAGYFDITVLDHLIVSEGGYFSFADEGLL